MLSLPESPLPLIFGLSGTELTPEEAELFRSAGPAGFILFRRNIRDPDQLRQLTDRLREFAGEILIDQEGGRVQRLQPPHWPDRPAARHFGRAAPAELRDHVQALSRDLRRAGITVNCAPVIDVPVEGGDESIGDRGFSTDPMVVLRCARIWIEESLEAGITPVIKHLPGQGTAQVDSHEMLPRTFDATPDEVRIAQLLAEEYGSDLWGMAAHMLYDNRDPENPASQSSAIIQHIIRQQIGLTGKLLSDDIVMKALEGAMSARAHACLGAGCDLVLHCSGNLQEMREIVETLC